MLALLLIHSLKRERQSSAGEKSEAPFGVSRKGLPSLWAQGSHFIRNLAFFFFIMLSVRRSIHHGKIDFGGKRNQKYSEICQVTRKTPIAEISFQRTLNNKWKCPRSVLAWTWRMWILATFVLFNLSHHFSKCFPLFQLKTMFPRFFADSGLHWSLSGSWSCHLSQDDAEPLEVSLSFKVWTPYLPLVPWV